MIWQEDDIKGCRKVLGESWDAGGVWWSRWVGRITHHRLTGEGAPGSSGKKHGALSQKICFLLGLSAARGRGNLSGVNVRLLWRSGERSQGLFKKVSSATTDPHDFILTVLALLQKSLLSLLASCAFLKTKPSTTCCPLFRQWAPCPLFSWYFNLFVVRHAAILWLKQRERFKHLKPELPTSLHARLTSRSSVATSQLHKSKMKTRRWSGPAFCSGRSRVGSK